VKRTPQAFTTVEILVVVGILLLLVGMLFVGMRYVGRTGGVNATKTTLANARAMLTEYEVNSRLDRIYGIYPGGAMTPIDAPGLVTEGSPARDDEDGAVHETHEVMTLLIQIPNNRAALEQMPPNRLMPDDDGVHAPILLDAWNNPIIFVPPGGLRIYDPVDDTELMIVQSPDNRPFFASAGPDGTFLGIYGSGDAPAVRREKILDGAANNLYSFQD
jgi:type II secretory pathway pseudopilin PulG